MRRPRLRNTSVLTALVTVLILVVNGCANHSQQTQFIADNGYPLSRVDEAITLIEAAIINPDNPQESVLLVKYQQHQQSYYATSTEKNRENLSIHQDWYPVYQVFGITPSDYQSQRLQAHKIPILKAQHWDSFVDHLLTDYLPTGINRGALLNIRDNEVFIYRDANGDIQELDNISHKPSDVTIEQSYRIEDSSQGILSKLSTFLSQQNINDQRVLIETGEVGAYARPFVLVDFEVQQLYFASFEDFTSGSMPADIGTTSGKVGWHFVRSYLFDAVNRPVTYVSRLVFFLSDTVIDATQGLYLNLFGHPQDTEIPSINQTPAMDISKWDRYLDQHIKAPNLSGNIELLIGGDQFFPHFISAIQGAKESVDVRSYIFDRDDFAIEVADLLKEKSKNVPVRVMVDGLGTLMAQNNASATMPAEHKAPLGITTYLRENSKVKVRSLTNPWFTGDHTKTSIIDNNVVFMGGMNIGREYRWEWHDAMVKVTGPAATFIQEDFNRTWAQSQILGDFVFAGYALKHPRKSTLEEPQGYPIRILRTRPHDSQIYKAQLAAIRQSQQYIYVANAYFSDAKMIYELTQARQRGVDVRVIIPVGGNHGIMNKNNVSAANKLLKQGVRIFAYPGMSHIKAAIFDGWACFGSANFDKLSFRVNKEMNLGVSDPKFIGQLQSQLFKPDFEHSVEILEQLEEDWSHTFASILASQL